MKNNPLRQPPYSPAYLANLTRFLGCMYLAYAMGESYTYEYDDAGNIAYKRTYDYTLGDLGNATELQFTYDDDWKDLLLAVGNQTCAYNTAGQPTTYKGNTFTWLNGQLRFAHGATLYYYGNGIRSGKDSIKYYYQDGKLLWQTDGTNTLRFLYDGDEVIGFVRQMLNIKTTYLYRRNVLGDIVSIYNTSNALQARYVYDAWGNHKVLNPNGTENTSSTFIGNINPLRYRGYYYDADLGLYYLMTRYYDPEVGRFISADGIEYLDPETIGGLNLFAYCNNNPVMGTDPDGTSILTVLSIVLMGIGIVAGTMIGAYEGQRRGEELGLDDGHLIGLTVSGSIVGAFLGAAGAGLVLMLVGGISITAMVATGVAASLGVIGMLAYDIAAMFEAPILGLDMEPIGPPEEYDGPKRQDEVEWDPRKWKKAKNRRKK